MSRPSAWLSRVFTPYLVLIVALLVTGGVAYRESTTSRNRTEARLGTLALETRDAIAARIEVYAALLQSGAGLFAASEAVTLSEFRAFAGELELREHYPGMQGLGYAARFPASRRAALTADIRAQGMSGFDVKPGDSRPDYTSIVYLEPLDERNRAAIGYDMFTETIRREAMVRARDTGQSAASGPVVLLQEIDRVKLPGFLIYHPVYTKGPEPSTVAERRARLEGYVYCPIRAPVFCAEVMGIRARSMLDVEIYEGMELDPSKLLYDSWPKDPPGTHHGAISRTRRIPVAGRMWTMVASSRPGFQDLADVDRSGLVLLVGILLSLLLFGLTILQARARSQAEQAARRLRVSESALASANSQISSVLESIADGFISVDREWRVVYVNQRAGKLAGRSPEEVVGRSVWDVYPNLQGTDAEAHIRAAMEGGAGVQFEACDALMPDWSEVRAYPAGDGLSLYFADIKDRKKAEATLLEAYRQHRQISTTLQKALLDVDLPQVRGLRIEPYYRAALEEAQVGGDFYDVFEPAPGFVGMVIGDVAGKGLGAAARTALVKHTLRALAYEDPAPANVLTRLNRIVTRETREGFVTLFYGLYNVSERELQFANAGHEPPLWLIPDGPRVLQLERPGMLLGVESDFAYEQYRIEMDRGHEILLYTDGITEARNGQDLYGVERLMSAFVEAQAPGARETLNGLLERVYAFANGEIGDDVAAVLLFLE